MAAFYQKCCLMGISYNDWLKDGRSSTETLECSAGSNVSPTSPLELAFERDTPGVTVGLGLVPYLARLWLEDPFETRIVFSINMGIDHFSKSLIEGSKANAFEADPPNTIPPPTILNSSTPSSLLSPASHIPQIGSPPEMQRIFEASPNYEFDLDYYHFTMNNNESYENNHQSAGSDVLMGSAAGSEASLISSGSSEYIYGSLDEIMSSSQIAHQEEYTRVVSRGVNPMTTHIYNTRVMEPRPVVGGGLSATFGNAANRHVPGFQYPTEGFMTHCHLCRKPLYKEKNDIFIFKGEFAYCSIQCRQVDIDMEEERDKAEAVAQKQSAAKHLERAGKSPVFFGIGGTSASKK